MSELTNGRWDGYEHQAPVHTSAGRARRLASMPCACGGEITSPSRITEDVMHAIRFHQESDRHRVWRLRWSHGEG